MAHETILRQKENWQLILQKGLKTMNCAPDSNTLNSLFARDLKKSSPIISKIDLTKTAVS